MNATAIVTVTDLRMERVLRRELDGRFQRWHPRTEELKTPRNCRPPASVRKLRVA